MGEQLLVGDQFDIQTSEVRAEADELSRLRDLEEIRDAVVGEVG